MWNVKRTYMYFHQSVFPVKNTISISAAIVTCTPLITTLSLISTSFSSIYPAQSGRHGACRIIVAFLVPVFSQFEIHTSTHIPECGHNKMVTIFPFLSATVLTTSSRNIAFNTLEVCGQEDFHFSPLVLLNYHIHNPPPLKCFPIHDIYRYVCSRYMYRTCFYQFYGGV